MPGPELSSGGSALLALTTGSLAALMIAAGVSAKGLGSLVLAVAAVIASLVLAIVDVLFSGCCTPLSVVATVVGAIILANPNVLEAYRMRARGASVDEIREHLDP